MYVHKGLDLSVLFIAHAQVLEQCLGIVNAQLICAEQIKENYTVKFPAIFFRILSSRGNRKSALAKLAKISVISFN